MTAPSKIRAAQSAPDRVERIQRMAHLMRHHQNGPEGACTYRHLHADGFTEAEIVAYRDAARELLSQRRPVSHRTPKVVHAPMLAREEGKRLVRQARKIRRRLAETQPSTGTHG